MFLPPVLRLARLVWPRFAAGLFIPTHLVRRIVFKLFRDIHAIPSALDLVKLATRFMLSNDGSQWDRALQMPHYNATDMPAVSVFQLMHMVQCTHAGRFQMYDYGGAAANAAAYGPEYATRDGPPDIAAQYGRLGGMPVDLVAGTHDGVIPAANIRAHHSSMLAAGVRATYREFEFGHLDFTFAVKEDLKLYMMRLLRN